MVKYIAVTATLLSLVTASPLVQRQRMQPDLIAVGRQSYTHGNIFVAWVPTITTLQEACTTYVYQLQSCKMRLAQGLISYYRRQSKSTTLDFPDVLFVVAPSRWAI